jgi:hypothetical protein
MVLGQTEILEQVSKDINPLLPDAFPRALLFDTVLRYSR